MGLRYFSILVVVLSSALIGVWSQLPPEPVQFIPTLYVTDAPERQSADKAVMYVATMCNPKLYDSYMAISRINIPSGWKPDIGYFGKLEVCSTSSCDTILCSNYPDGIFDGSHYCSFLYNVTIGNVYIRATSGPAPNIDWTVALQFVSKKEFDKNSGEQPRRRLFDVPEPKARNKISPNDIKVLTQLIPTGVRESVTTLNKLQFIMSFCPNSQTTERYNIDIVVTALDSKSAMATYVCLPPLKVPCSPTTATQSDPRGIGLNVVTLQTGSGTLKDVYVLIVGWGDGEQENTFMIGAILSKY